MAGTLILMTLKFNSGGVILLILCLPFWEFIKIGNIELKDIKGNIGGYENI